MCYVPWNAFFSNVIIYFIIKFLSKLFALVDSGAFRGLDLGRLKRGREWKLATVLSVPLSRVVAVGPTSARCSADVAYGTVDELKAAFFAEVRPGDSVLLKASHSMGLGALLKD